jgi:putative addiction module CopG family antidote
VGVLGERESTMETSTVALSEEMSLVVARAIQTGRFRSGEAVVEAALRLYAGCLDDGDNAESLDRQIQEGLDDLEAGRSVVLGSEEEIRSLIAGIGKQVAARYQADAE